MIRLIKTEFIKMRRSNIWLSIALLPIIAVILGGGNYYFNIEVLQKQWYSLWTQTSLFYGWLFYTVSIAIAASYSWRMEHKDNNWNRILAMPYSHFQLILSKVIAISTISLLIQTVFMLLYYIAGKFIFQFSMVFPKEIILWITMGWIASISICAMQSFISMKIKSFAIPVGISLFLCFVGIIFFAVNLFNGNIVYLSPNSLLMVSMSSNRTEIMETIEYIKVLASTICFTIIFIFISTKSLKKKFL